MPGSGEVSEAGFFKEPGDKVIVVSQTARHFMTDITSNFTGRWLYTGERQGKDFSHQAAEYHHAEQSGPSTKMRHAIVEQEGQQVGVWVPSDWTDDQVRDALTSNW